MTQRVKTPESLRSARWFAPDDLRSFGHRSRAMQMGYSPEEWTGRPVIAIAMPRAVIAISDMQLLSAAMPDVTVPFSPLSVKGPQQPRAPPKGL